METFDAFKSINGFKRNTDLELWEKSYWFLRYFIDTNRFGALAKDSKKINSICSEILTTYKLSQVEENTENERKEILSRVLSATLNSSVKDGSKKGIAVSELFNQLQNLLISSKDYFILAITIKELLLPTNRAIENVPTTESTEFARKYGKAVLETKKENGLASLIRDWDNFTEELSLNKERDIIVGLIRNIRTNLPIEITNVR